MLHTTGVTNSVTQVLRHLERNGHEVRVVAPRAVGEPDDAGLPGTDVALLRSFPLPSYPDVRLTVAPVARLEAILREFIPDVVHLASPFVLGWQFLRAADHLGIPTVAIYQTDIPGYAQRYGIPLAAPALTAHVARIHRRATLTLAPSSSSMRELGELGVDRLRLWARGVDAERFSPARRSPALRARFSPDGEVVIGYIGRLAPEKQVEDLRALVGLPNTRLVIVGDGPSRAALEAQLPDALFLGFQSGTELAESVASFDLFVHPGENETFCQTIQEALASGVPTIATGRGGPVDLVRNSVTGWLYRPGDLDDLRARVADLAGDAGKRRAFSVAARASVETRTWASLGDELIGHYRDAIAERRAIATGRPTGRLSIGARPTAPAAASVASTTPVATAPRPTAPRWSRYVALGDSITEGLCDSSRQADGVYRGWADRLAMLLAHAGTQPDPLLYANLAVRSRTVDDVVERQIPHALRLEPDLVTVLIGANDLVRGGWRPARLADRLGRGISRLRSTGADVLLVTPFIPPRTRVRLLHDRAAVYARELARVAAETGSLLLDVTHETTHEDVRMWAADRVHLSSHGHRVLSYRAAAALGVPGAGELGALDHAMHAAEEIEADPLTTPAWLWQHARPWVGRRVRGRTAGDGLDPKHDRLVPVFPADASGAPAPVER